MDFSNPLRPVDEPEGGPPGSDVLVVAVNKLIFAATCIILAVVPFVSGPEDLILHVCSVIPPVEGVAPDVLMPNVAKIKHMILFSGFHNELRVFLFDRESYTVNGIHGVAMYDDFFSMSLLVVTEGFLGFHYGC